VNCPDSGVECVGDVENARILVQVQAPRLVEHHFGGQSFLAVETRLARASDRRDLAVSIDLADHAVVVVAEEQVSLSIEGEADRVFQSSLYSRPSVTRVAPFARARNRVDDAVFVDLADPVVLCIGDVDVSLAIECDVVCGQLRLSSRTSVA
jgi:hypothetical protein